MSSNSVRSGSGDHLPECESLRGIAILLVFCFHYLGSLYGYQSAPDAPIIITLLFGGDTGVTLFFVLSGFLLSRPFLQGSPLQLGPYLWRRALRILPMFYLLVLLAALWSGQWRQALSALIFHNIHVGVLPPMGNVWWSLVIEVQFYLLLPLLVWLLRCRGGRYLIVPLISIAAYAYYQVCISGVGTGLWEADRNSIIGRWPLFMVGVLLAWAQLHYSNGVPLFNKHGWLGVVVLIISILALHQIITYRVHHFGGYAHIFWYAHYLWEAIAWAVFVFVLMNCKFPGRVLFINPALHHIGLWSYSIYLLHSSVLFFLFKRNPLLPLSWKPNDWLGELALGIFLFLVAAGLSAFTYRWIERPFLRLKYMPWRKATIFEKRVRA